VLHVGWQTMARIPAKESNNVFRMACFMLFLSRGLNLASSVDQFGKATTLGFA
jgi:hypothetical protein